MKFNHIAVASLLVVSLSSAAFAAKSEMTAKDWQNKSLKGIASIRYGVAWDPSGSLTKSVTSSLSGVKIPMKSVSLDSDKATSLKAGEGRVKVYVDNRDKNECWVGLTVDQMAQLDRDPSITFDSETYSVGKLVSQSQADAAVKEVCEQFAKDFNEQAK